MNRNLIFISVLVSCTFALKANAGQSEVKSAKTAVVLPKSEEVLQREKALLKETYKNCGHESLTVCRQFRKNLMPLRKCLLEQSPSIKDPCKSHIRDYTRDYVNRINEVCKAHILQFCPGLRFDLMLDCLRKNPEISVDCKKTVN